MQHGSSSSSSSAAAPPSSPLQGTGPPPGFQVEDCARELYEAGRLDESRLLDRSGRLLRDFLMAPLTRGARGAGRKVRMATKRGVAWVVAQFVVVAIYTVILVLIMAFLYRGGTRFDPLFEWLMPGG